MRLLKVLNSLELIAKQEVWYEQRLIITENIAYKLLDTDFNVEYF